MDQETLTRVYVIRPEKTPLVFTSLPGGITHVWLVGNEDHRTLCGYRSLRPWNTHFGVFERLECYTCKRCLKIAKAKYGFTTQEITKGRYE